jgi:hypothetical protein
MEKMGWEEGKGLGATAQGMTDPITVRAKDNNQVRHHCFSLLKLLGLTNRFPFFNIRVLDIKVEMMFGSITKMTLMPSLLI